MFLQPCDNANEWAEILKQALYAIITVCTTYATLRARQASKDVNVAFSEIRKIKKVKQTETEDAERN